MIMYDFYCHIIYFLKVGGSKYLEYHELYFLLRVAYGKLKIPHYCKQKMFSINSINLKPPSDINFDLFREIIMYYGYMVKSIVMPYYLNYDKALSLVSLYCFRIQYIKISYAFIKNSTFSNNKSSDNVIELFKLINMCRTHLTLKKISLQTCFVLNYSSRGILTIIRLHDNHKVARILRFPRRTVRISNRDIICNNCKEGICNGLYFYNSTSKNEYVKNIEKRINNTSNEKCQNCLFYV